MKLELRVEINIGVVVSMVDICSDDKTDEDKVSVELERISVVIVVVSISLTKAVLV
jgi:hypothetical protein